MREYIAPLSKIEDRRTLLQLSCISTLSPADFVFSQHSFFVGLCAHALHQGLTTYQFIPKTTLAKSSIHCKKKIGIFLRAEACGQGKLAYGRSLPEADSAGMDAGRLYLG